MQDDQFIVFDIVLIIVKETQTKVLVGNNITVVWSTACPVSDLFGKGDRYWAQLTLRPISALPCQINQISDSSRPNNCMLLFPNVKIDWNSRGYIIFDI